MQRNEYVRFFDDLPLEYVRLREENNVENYACKQKLQYVRKARKLSASRSNLCFAIEFLNIGYTYYLQVKIETEN